GGTIYQQSLISQPRPASIPRERGPPHVPGRAVRRDGADEVHRLEKVVAGGDGGGTSQRGRAGHWPEVGRVPVERIRQTRVDLLQTPRGEAGAGGLVVRVAVEESAEPVEDRVCDDQLARGAPGVRLGVVDVERSLEAEDDR